jgi:hypothetical protein
MLQPCLPFSLSEGLNQLYPFTYSPGFSPTRSGWCASSPEDLIKRWKCDLERFRVSSVNRNFALCSSYPEETIVPFGITDEDIRKVCTHETRRMALVNELYSVAKLFFYLFV